MANLRIPEAIWQQSHDWLFGRKGEHFAFFLGRWTFSRGEPVLIARDVILIPDAWLSGDWDGATLTVQGILHVINAATKNGDCLIEAHNHGGSKPRFSLTDLDGLHEFVPYVHDSLPDRPYGATVWGDTYIYGEYFLPDGQRGVIDSITVTGKWLREVVSIDGGHLDTKAVFDRQLPWFTAEGQRQLGFIRVGVVGCGGTGSQILQNLVFLGCREFVLIDDDSVEDTNMNRLVTATPADIGTPKVIVGRILIKTVAPNAHVIAVNDRLQSANALDALKGTDVIFGCLDNDGGRLVLNEFALAYGIPYIDLGVQIDATDGVVNSAGGRVAMILPEGPCLNCMGEIDPEEARFFLASPEERSIALNQGYVSGAEIKSPAVVSLNATIAAIAVNEFVTLISQIRSINTYSEYDLLGVGRSIKSQWLSPTRVKANNSCVQCAVAGLGDKAELERYIGNNHQRRSLEV